MVITVNKEYMKLIKRFPLRAIKNDQEHEAALSVFDELTEREDTHTSDEHDYLMLVRLIKDYEDKDPLVQAFMIGAAKITSTELLASLIVDNGLTQTKLAQELGMDQGNLSAFLSGKRGLSKDNAIKLAKRFKVSADLFFRNHQDGSLTPH